MPDTNPAALAPPRANPLHSAPRGGFLAAAHFGQAYISGEGRVYVTPNPGALAFLGGVGVNL